MSKAILEFDLNDYDDRLEHMRCVKSKDLVITMFEIVVNLRRQCEHKLDVHDDVDNLDAYYGVSLVFDEINEILRDRGVNIDELLD